MGCASSSIVPIYNNISHYVIVCDMKAHIISMNQNILTKLKETGKDDELKQRHLKEYYRIIQWIVSQDLNATHIIQLLQHDKYGGLFISSRQGGKMTPARVIKKLKSRKIPYET